MKPALLFALIFPGFLLATPDPASAGTVWRFHPNRTQATRTVRVTRTTVQTLPAIGSALEPVVPIGTGSRTAEGVLPRLLTADDPVQMINPLAPPAYGSARNLVVYGERDPYRTNNLNRTRLQPEGIRFLTIRPLW